MWEALESSAPAMLLRGSFVLYPLVNAAHILAIGLLVTSALLMDLRVLGLGRAVPLPLVVFYLRPLAIGALLVAATTGAMMFSVQATEYVNNSAFRWKLVLLALAVANAVLFTLWHPGGTAHRLLTSIMAAISVLLWLSVLVAGRFIGFVA